MFARSLFIFSVLAFVCLAGCKKKAPNIEEAKSYQKALALIDEGEAAVASSNMVLAKNKYSAALKESQNKEWPDVTGMASMGLGTVYFSQLKFEKASQAWQESFEELSTVLVNDKSTLANLKILQSRAFRWRSMHQKEHQSLSEAMQIADSDKSAAVPMQLMKAGANIEMARYYYLYGQYHKAIELLDQADEIYAKIKFPEKFPKTSFLSGSMVIKARILFTTGDIINARKLAEAATRHGSIPGYETLAHLLEQTGNHRQAVAKYDAILKLLNEEKQPQGEIEFDKANALLGKGSALIKMNKKEEGLEQLERGVAIYTKYLGKNSEYSLRAAVKSARAKRELGGAKLALTIHKDLLDKLLAIYEKEIPVIALVIEEVALDLHAVENYTKAKEYHLNAIKILREFFPNGSPLLAETLEGLGKTQFALKEYKEATVHFMESILMREKIFGDNKHTQQTKTWLDKARAKTQSPKRR